MDIKSLSTQLFIGLITLVVIVYDIYVRYSWGVKYTITDTIRTWANQYKVIPVALAAGMFVLWWHLFVTDSNYVVGMKK